MAWWLSQQEDDSGSWVQILNEAVYNSHSINTLGKGMNPSILSLAMCK